MDELGLEIDRLSLSIVLQTFLGFFFPGSLQHVSKESTLKK